MTPDESLFTTTGAMGMTAECPDCYGTGVIAGELCPLCNGRSTVAINNYELAQQARERAVANYTAHAKYLTNQGDKLYPVDPDGAQALWLDAMKSLDAANTAEEGL